MPSSPSCHNLLPLSGPGNHWPVFWFLKLCLFQNIINGIIQLHSLWPLTSISTIHFRVIPVFISTFQVCFSQDRFLFYKIRELEIFAQGRIVIKPVQILNLNLFKRAQFFQGTIYCIYYFWYYQTHNHEELRKLSRYCNW